jgi:hypothetical protein
MAFEFFWFDFPTSSLGQFKSVGYDLVRLPNRSSTVPRFHQGEKVLATAVVGYGQTSRHFRSPGFSSGFGFTSFTSMSVVTDVYFDASGNSTRTMAFPGWASFGTWTGPW